MLSVKGHLHPRQRYWPYHPPFHRYDRRKYFEFIVRRETELFEIEKQYRHVMCLLRSIIYTKFKTRCKKYDEFDGKDFKEFFEVIDMSGLGYYLDPPDKKERKKLIDVTYTRAWKHLGGSLSGKRHEDITQILFTHLYEYCLGERVMHAQQAKGMQYLLDQLTQEDIEDISCDMELHDIRTIKDINDLSSALIECVCQGLIPLSYADKLHNLLRAKMTFLYYGEDRGKLAELEQLVIQAKALK